eukprot:GHVS01010230.1.p1 GENE.GHVS01010230.1~~GHVS01010230.1.p1  ORF type:complete len:431 (-),score=96.47 GHVS01010230.1:200-1492(-)
MDIPSEDIAASSSVAPSGGGGMDSAGVVVANGSAEAESSELNSASLNNPTASPDSIPLDSLSVESHESDDVVPRSGRGAAATDLALLPGVSSSSSAMDSTTSLALSAPLPPDEETGRNKVDSGGSDNSSSQSNGDSSSSSSDGDSSSSTDSESDSNSDDVVLSKRKKSAPGNSDSDDAPLGNKKKLPVKSRGVVAKVKPELKKKGKPEFKGVKRAAETKAGGGQLKRSNSSASNLASAKCSGSPRRRKAKQEEDDEEEESTAVSMGVLKNRNPKQNLVAQFLKRWWFALPPWPPVDYDFRKVLGERKLKWISLEEWEDAEDVDEEGYTKVYEISSFPGVFRDPSGQALDLRPKESCPSYVNFMSKSETELLRLISKAINNQLVELQKSPYDETLNRKNLIQELSKVDRDLAKLERRDGYLKDRNSGVKGE